MLLVITMKEKMYELFLTKKYIESPKWSELFEVIAKYNGIFNKFQIILYVKDNIIHYYLKTKCSLPPVINGLDSFILHEDTIELESIDKYFIYFSNYSSNIIDIKNKLEIKNKGSLKYVIINIKRGIKKLKYKTKLIMERDGKLNSYSLLFSLPSTLLSIDFNQNYNILYKGAPKYLDISKTINLFNNNANTSLFKVDTFPYLQGSYYLDLNNYNFAVHSVIFGSSGCGKSKFISSFIYNLYKITDNINNYRVLLIDPHAALEQEIGGIGRVIDFKSKRNSLNLFQNNSEDVIVSVELLLDLFKGLIANNYNSKLERVLRHSIYLLLVSNNFNFTNLRKVVLDLEYRTELINLSRRDLPFSIIDFFGTEFNELKTKSYGEVISPIIAFIDEMELIPVFNNDGITDTLESIINDNFLNIISLDRTRLGGAVTKTIAGLTMQQLFTKLQSYMFDKHIIFIIDEVAIVENPILKKFLSEARKYNCSVILAGQYFNQISEDLKESIFANVMNYYLFRVSQGDANTLVKQINMKVPLSDDEETKIRILSDLKNRECILRINQNGTLLPAFKGVTNDFVSIPRIKAEEENKELMSDSKKLQSIKFNIGNVDMRSILESSSSSRKDDFDE